ncbi:MAG: hypothetical protein JSV99_09920 [Planctomycetota bacterium]|nr:MAG: hypothetical protein JSV99_09920 [Planctomycetota bacterium]
MKDPEITEDFLSALRRYLSGEILMDEAVKRAKLKTRKQFQDRLKSAYVRRQLVVRRRIDPEMGIKVREWIHRSRGIGKGVEVYVVNGIPNDETFFSAAAEKLLAFFKERLQREDKEEITIGIVSGTSTADLVEYVGKLWEEVMGGLNFEEREKKRKINIVAMCSTTLKGPDLEGNANISTLILAKLLDKKLPDFKVTPYGISTELVVFEENLEEVDGRVLNKERLRIVDPSRLKEGSNGKSKLDILIAGVGLRGDKEHPDSVLQKVIQAEGIELPEEVVGDVGFWPIDREGHEVEIRDKDSKKLMVYSLITPTTMRELAKGGGIVMLIARNHRRGQKVSKTIPIRAAIRGGYANVIFTDEDTANELLEERL